ncbi:MAG: hypothetical protein ACYS6I_07845 [Planctomycetota bacterium]|jgi:hypothetical protein
MKLNSPNVNTVSGLISRSPFKKPKVVTAAVLISIMAFMWVKVLVNHRADKNEARAASAQTAAQKAAVHQQEKLVKITLHPLPAVPGRNDVLNHDIFTADGWKAFPSDSRTGSGTFPKEIDRNDAGYIDKIAETITLEAVISGTNPEAFIGGKLVSVGHNLPVRYNEQIYEFTVTEIHALQRADI